MRPTGHQGSNPCPTAKNIMIDWLITFAAVFVTDLIYVYFAKSIQHDKPFAAAFWSTVVTFTASIAVINYTSNHLLLTAALAGAYTGTLFGMLIRKRVS